MSSSSRRLLRLCHKELRETLRDRRTIVTLVLMPLLIYPLLSMTLNRFLVTAKAENTTTFRIQADTKSQAEFLQALLNDPHSSPPQPIRDAAGDLPLAEFQFFVATDDRTAREALADGDVHVVVEVIESLPREIVFTALQNSQASQQARRILIERTQWYNAAVARERLAQLRGGQAAEPALVVRTTEIEGQGGTPLLGTVVPLMLVLMTITGAVYPAIDLTAGERERGTIEAVIASPVPRGSILFAKYTAVVTVAMLTAMVNLFAMFVTLWAGGLLQLLLGKDAPFPFLEILQILALLVLFSSFFSAVLLALTSFARSFKEAQAYLIPLMLLSLAPGMLSLLPGIELSGVLAVVPLVNIILLTRDVLAGSVAALPASAAIVSTMVYAAAALGVAARLFGSDAVLRSSELSIGSMFSRPLKPRDTPTVSEAMMTMALLFPIYFVASNALGHWAPETMSGRLIVNAVALIVLFGGIPILVSRISRDRFRSTFRLLPASLGSLAGAFCIGLGLWAFAFEAILLAELLGVRAMDTSNLALAQDAKTQMQQLSPLLLLSTFALTPGVIEELCYRGYLFSALERRLQPWRTILLCAILFGLFHVLTGSVLRIERFIPSTMVGVVLGWVSWRAGSIFPAMVLHFTHDALLMLVIRYEPWLQQQGWDVSNEQHLPAMVLGLAALAILVGALAVWGTTRAPQNQT
ncbi:ABC transporter permease subunit/CPBP intramembrane protease [Roseimaritima ulvae]|uniref:ABC-2 family transporter protein n=1 Tax=Roseimaritima ulvae TaxID=980254 RepID=A0A5B9QZ27_9BACT|nr:ABC transporter permease subunit/CPBP intramembrane protease [Roseimaritima ulvae]QEG42665.1 ABC-2 family transporter protein [Roseimaritima ulvae]